MEESCVGIVVAVIVAIIGVCLIGEVMNSVFSTFSQNLILVVGAGIIATVVVVILGIKDKKKKETYQNIFMFYIVPGIIIYVMLNRIGNGIGNGINLGSISKWVLIMEILGYYVFPVYCIASAIFVVYMKKKKVVEKERRIRKEQVEKQRKIDWERDIKIAKAREEKKKVAISKIKDKFNYIAYMENDIDMYMQENEKGEIRFKGFNRNMELIDINIANIRKSTEEIYYLLNNCKDTFDKLYRFLEGDVLTNKLTRFDNKYGTDEIKKIKKAYMYFCENYREIYKGYSKKTYGISLGKDGEDKVNNSLKVHSNIINVPNIQVEAKKGSDCECDNILITTRGIFILEVKNYADKNQYKIYIDETGRWEKVSYGGKRESINNATSQNNRHVGIVNEVINNDLGRGMENAIEAKGIIVFANDNVDIINKSDNRGIIRISEIYRYVTEGEKILSEEDIYKIRQILENHRISNKEYPVLNYEMACQYIDSTVNYFEKIISDLEVLEREGI